MEWTDEAIVLSARPHGEAAVVATLLTRSHGRHSGLVQGWPFAQAARQPAIRQSGQRPLAGAACRTSRHLHNRAPVKHFGRMLGRSPAARLPRLRLRRHGGGVARPGTARPVFHGLAALLDAFETPLWAASYVRWEAGIASGTGLRPGSRHLRRHRHQRRSRLRQSTHRPGSLVSAGSLTRTSCCRCRAFLLGEAAAWTRKCLPGWT